jgi:hypothetical protein
MYGIEPSGKNYAIAVGATIAIVLYLGPMGKGMPFGGMWDFGNPGGLF